jgi:hypothetical protein
MVAKLNRTDTTRKHASVAKYEGALAEPLPELGTFATEAEINQRAAELARRTILLFQHYRIVPSDGDAYRNLSFALMKRHVGGFRPAPRQGRPATRKHDDCLIFMLSELLKHRDGMTERQASNMIADLRLTEWTAETLRRRLTKWKHDNRLGVEFFARLAKRVGNANYVNCLEYGLEGYLPRN